VELFDGERWVAVAGTPADLTLSLGDGSVESTVLPPTTIPDGTFTEMRITADEAAADLTFSFDGEQLSAHLEVVPPAGQSIVIEKEITVTEEGGQLTLRIDIESIQTIEIVVVPGEGATVTVTGEVTPDGASASATAA
jgi:hypothetical protein